MIRYNSLKIPYIPAFRDLILNLCFEGVVKGVVFCGAESEAIRDPTFWKVRISE